MHHRWFWPKAVGVAGLLPAILLLLSSAGAVAAPERLDCSLTKAEIQSGSQSEQVAENRSIIIVFDGQTRALTVYQDADVQALSGVTITQSSMSGAVGEIMLGIDRSSWGIVFQTYGSDSMRAEFGECNLSAEPPP
jgi:hypothetical protein